MDKKLLRKELISIRKDIPFKDEKSMIIMEKIISLDVFKKARVIALYKSLLYEVNTDYLINYAQDCGKIILLPRVVSEQMFFIIYHKNDILEENSFHVFEPLYNENNIYYGDIDLIIVPGVGFDINNNRLGYGRAYYDRFLKDKNIFKMGICFREQLIETIPFDTHDIKMDVVITN